MPSRYQSSMGLDFMNLLGNLFAAGYYSPMTNFGQRTGDIIMLLAGGGLISLLEVSSPCFFSIQKCM